MKNKVLEVYNIIMLCLSNAGVYAPAFETFIIIKTVFNKHYIDLNDEDITEEKLAIVDEILEKRKDGYPLQYILRQWDFWNLKFKVGEGVLIPRGETELLVEVGLSIIEDIKNPVIVDLCSGSGCVAISLAKEREDSKVYAIEKSKIAYQYLIDNIQLNNISNIIPILGDLIKESEKFDKVKFDLIISNPPYIATSEIDKLQREVKFEPTMALDGGLDGLCFYRNIAQCWSQKIKKGGGLAVEVGFNQSLDVINIMKDNKLVNLRSWKDINGIERVISGKTKI